MEPVSRNIRAIIGQALAGNFQFSQSAVIVAIPPVKILPHAQDAFHQHPDEGERPPAGLLPLTPGARMYGRRQGIKPIMSVGELAIGIEKRWIMRDSLV